MSDFDEARLLNRAFVQAQRAAIAQESEREERKAQRINGFVEAKLMARVKLTPQQVLEMGAEREAKLEEIERRIKDDVAKKNGRKLVLSRMNRLDGGLEVRGTFKVWVPEKAVLEKLERDSKLAEALSK